MAKGRKGTGVEARLEALLAQGDHAAARAEARRVLSDAGAAGGDRQAATATLRSLEPEPGAVRVGLAAVALAAGVAAWLLRG